MTPAVTECPEDITEKFNTWATFKEPISTSQFITTKKKKPHETVHKLQVLRDMPINYKEGSPRPRLNGHLQ